MIHRLIDHDSRLVSSFVILLLAAVFAMGAGPCASSAGDDIGDLAEGAAASDDSDDEPARDDEAGAAADESSGGGDSMADGTDESAATQNSTDDSETNETNDASSESNNQQTKTAGWRGIPQNDDQERALRKARDKHEPDRCRSDSSWEDERTSSSDGGTSAVAGTGGAGGSDPLIISHGIDYQVFCGEEIQGLDPHYHDDEALPGAAEEMTDIRITLGYGLYFDRIDDEIAYGDYKTDDLDEDRRDLFKVVLRHQCFDQASYNAAKHYPTYDWCRRRTRPDEFPSRSRVKSILEEHLPGKTFEHKNFMFLYDRGETMRQKVVEGFNQFEKNFPIVKKIYVDGPPAGIDRYEGLRDKFSDVYDKMQPVTDALDNGEPPPEGCGAELESLQNDLANRLDVEKTVQAVHDFKFKHPAGRQLTEAIAYCHSYDKHAETRFRLENEWLDKSEPWVVLGDGLAPREKGIFKNRFFEERQLQPTDEQLMSFIDSVKRVPPARITRIQHIVHARQDKFDANKADANLPEFLKERTRIPDLEREFLAELRPEIEYQHESAASIRDFAGAYDDEEYEVRENVPPPHIESFTETPVGFQLEFPTNTRVIKNETCDKWETTDKVKSTEFVGGEMKVNYKKRCLKSSVKRGEVTDGFEPIIVSKWERDSLETGMRVYARSVPDDPKDSVLVDAWWPDRDAPVVLKGVHLR